MINLNTVLNERIARIARKEIKAQTGATRKAAVRYRGDIAALKRQIASLQKTVAFLESREKRRLAEQPVPQDVENLRFRADGLKTHRAKLGLSAKDYGALVGVSGLTIYHWESGKARPRREQLAKLAAVRGMGKREAFKKLESVGAPIAQSTRRRTRGGPTAEELVLSLVKSTKPATSAAINAGWTQAGRPGRANNTLTRLLKAKKLKRANLAGERGGVYSLA